MSTNSDELRGFYSVQPGRVHSTYNLNEGYRLSSSYSDEHWDDSVYRI